MWIGWTPDGKASKRMASTVSREFRLQMQGYGLTTAEIHYHMPDHPGLLQLYVWQEYDLAAFSITGRANSTARCIRSGSPIKG
jgi:hypothetical protein